MVRELCRRPMTLEVKSGGRNVLHVPSLPMREGESREKQLRVVTHEWSVAEGLTTSG